MAPKNIKNNSHKKLLCHLGALLVVTIWGGSFVSTKVLINHHLGPVEIYIYRFVMAYLLVLAMCHKKFLPITGAMSCCFLSVASVAARSILSLKTMLSIIRVFPMCR